jgi:5'/3'-nucleotidase SurE
MAAAVWPLSPLDRPAAQGPYRILVTNDDGIRAPGMLALARALAPLGEITIVAPAENQRREGAFDQHHRSDLRRPGRPPTD